MVFPMYRCEIGAPRVDDDFGACGRIAEFGPTPRKKRKRRRLHGRRRPAKGPRKVALGFKGYVGVQVDGIGGHF